MNQKNQSTTMRQSALVVGSGPGSLTVMKDGRTALMPGVDSWYVAQKRGYQTIPDDAKVYDKALAAALQVKYFVSPPAEGATETEGLVDGVLGGHVVSKVDCVYQRRLWRDVPTLKFRPQSSAMCRLPRQVKRQGLEKSPDELCCCVRGRPP